MSRTPKYEACDERTIRSEVGKMRSSWQAWQGDEKAGRRRKLPSLPCQETGSNSAVGTVAEIHFSYCVGWWRSIVHYIC
jgi:hypothetical protein